ncbi:MAG: hypothetical protein A4S12_09495 [Proteobacteria bacterium SG_bin5]|nr:glycosyltransferase family 9 protein [Sphingomonas sp.]OQW40968.1 MAG: hypothetical protein A4S12_09495 [Proteobacteria bacterium SG_bin5]
MKRVLVMRALGGLGDVLTAVPALERLRHAHPVAEITYMGLEQVRSVVARYPALVDAFLPFPGFPGIVEAPFAVERLAGFLADRAGVPGFDLAIQMHGSGSVSNVFTALLGARRFAGYHVPGLWAPEGSAPFPDHLREADRWLALVERLGCTEGAASPDFPLSAEERAAPARFGLARRYALIHPGASDPKRRWPPARFAQVADRLAREGHDIVLTGTPGEAALCAAVEAEMGARAQNLCGATDLGAMGGLVAGAALVVTNDTGTAHLAEALAAPSVTIFIASDPARWGAADRARHVAVGAGVPDVPIGAPPHGIAPSLPSVDQVLRAATSLMEMA